MRLFATHSPRLSPAAELLRLSANSFGLLAFADLLHASEKKPTSELAIQKPHFAPKAKRIIFLFMHGGPSQVDTFDPKPMLKKHNGQPYPGQKPRVQFANTGNLLQSPWEFRPGGESGIQVSDLFPEVRKRADDLCVIRSVHADNSAQQVAHTATAHRKRYLRTTEYRKLGDVRPRQRKPEPAGLHHALPHARTRRIAKLVGCVPSGEVSGDADWSLRYSGKEATVKDITPAASSDLQRMQLDLLKEMNADHLAKSGPDAALEARIGSFELAFRMQAEAPTITDITKEAQKTLDAYGIGNGKPTDNFGRQCLMARRFAEAGVRFIQCTHSYKWDQHGNLKKDHAKNALEVDQPIAALLADLKQRDLLKDTLVWWGGEFGRTPAAQGGDGRDHNPHAFSMWLAGGGVNGGTVYGSTDDFGYYAQENKVHMHDLRATILHLLGLDHEKLTYRYAGRDFRLTDVAGNVVKEILSRRRKISPQRGSRFAGKFAQRPQRRQ